MSWKDRAIKESEVISSKSSWKDRAIKEDEDKGITLEGLARGAVQTLPAVGGVLGGLAGTALGPVGLLGGGALGAGAGKALENVLESQLFGDEKTRQQIYSDPINEMSAEIVAPAILKPVVGALRAGRSFLTKGTLEPAENLAMKLQDTVSPRADRILEAAKTFDVTPTQGMLSDSPQIRGIESSLSQQPSTVGVNLKQNIDDIFSGVTKKVGGLSPDEALTPVQAGIAARKQIGEELALKTKSAVDFYNSIESTRDAIPINDIAKFRIADNISKLPGSKIAGSAEKSFLNNMSNSLLNLESLTDLKDLRTYAGNIARDKAASPNMRNAAGEVVDRLNRLERSSILRAAKDTGLKNGEAFGVELINEIKSANKTYAKASQEVKEIAQGMGLKVRNYQDFVRKIGDIDDEKILGKMFNENSTKTLLKMQKSFPKTYELLRKAKISEMYKNAVVQNGVNEGELNVKKLLNSVEKLSDESRELIFGKDASKILKDAKTVLASIPEKMGPSGTPQGLMVQEFNLFNPMTWYREIMDQAKKITLDNPGLTRGLAERGKKRAYMKIMEDSPILKDIENKKFLLRKGGLLQSDRILNEDE